jgi:N-acetylglucosaminyl-diphospho-decaprenol L-rhamnosyltransferase
MRVVVAIVSYSSAEDVAACLSRVMASTHPDYAVEICENAGPAAFAALTETVATLAPDLAPCRASGGGVAACSGHLEGGQPIRIVQAAENLGYAGGVNTCIRQRLDDPTWGVLWILNPDARPMPDALALMVAYLSAGSYGMVGARLVLSASRTVQLYGGRWRKLMARGYNIGLGQPMDHRPDVAAVESQMNYVHGACMVVARRFIDAVGLMEEDFFLYCEEVDWCLNGVKDFRFGYVHDAVVFHDHGSVIGSSTNRARRSRLSVYLDERNRLLLSRRRYPRLYPAIVLASLVLTLQYVRARAWRNFGHALHGWWAGVCGETGRPAWFEALNRTAPAPNPAQPASSPAR